MGDKRSANGELRVVTPPSKPEADPRHVARVLPAAEALLLLLAARMALRCLPVRWLLRAVSRPQRRALSPGQDRGKTLREVRWATLAVVRRAPLRFVCFPQCLAAHVMLRRRGIPSTLHYGVARRGPTLETHTWLQVGETVLLGGEVAGAFQLLASYSSEGAGLG